MSNTAIRSNLMRFSRYLHRFSYLSLTRHLNRKSLHFLIYHSYTICNITW